MDSYPPCPAGCAECTSTLRIRYDEFHNAPTTPCAADCVECHTFRAMLIRNDAECCDNAVRRAPAPAPAPASQASSSSSADATATAAAAAESLNDTDSIEIPEITIMNEEEAVRSMGSDASSSSTTSITNAANLATNPDRTPLPTPPTPPIAESEEAESEEEEENDLTTALLILAHNPLLLNLQRLFAKHRVLQREVGLALRKLAAGQARSEEVLEESIAVAVVAGAGAAEEKMEREGEEEE